MRSPVAGARAAIDQITPPIWRILAHSMLFGLASSIADVLFNFYLVSLGYAADTAGLLATIYRLAGALLGLPLGLLIDRAGPRASVLLGAAGFGLGYALLLASSEVWALAAAMFVVGTANILTITAVVPLLASVTDGRERANVFGLNAAAALLVGLLGASAGGLLPGLAAGLLAVDARDTAAYRMALGSVVLLGLASTIPLLRGIRVPSHVMGEPVAAQGTPSRVPLRRLVLLAVPSLLLGAGGGLFLPFQNLFFRQVFGLSDAAVGAMLAWASLGMGLGAMLGGPASGRLGVQRAAALLRLGAAPAMLIMLAPWLLPAAAGYFLRGLCVAASYPLNDALVMQATPARQRGIAVSLMSVLWSLGWSAAAWVSGSIQVTAGFGPVLAAAAVAYLLSGIAIAVVRVEGRA